MGFTRNASFLVCAGQQTDAIRLLHQRVPQKKKSTSDFEKITSSSAKRKATKPETPTHRLVAGECVTVGNFFRTPFETNLDSTTKKNTISFPNDNIMRSTGDGGGHLSPVGSAPT